MPWSGRSKPWSGRRDTFNFVCCAPGMKNGNGILQLFFPFLLQDCLGSEDQSCFRTLHRDWKEEEGKGLLRYSMGWGGHIFCGKVHRQENTLNNFSHLFCFTTVRSQRATGIGRLMVNIVEGIELKPCRSHGKCFGFFIICSMKKTFLYVRLTLKEVLSKTWFCLMKQF